jgi:hypothetical protein
VAEEVFLTVSAAGRVYDTPERNSDLEDAATHHMATHSTSLGISFAGSGLIVEGGQTPDNEDVSVGSPDTDSSDSFLGSNGSFERWARGDGQAHDNGNADTITTTHPLAERSSQTEESAHRETSVVYEAPRQLILPPPGTALSEIDAFAATWAENVAIQQSTLDPDCPRSPNQHPATQGQPSPRPGKYSYTSPEAASRLTYIRSYLSLPKDKASADVLLALLHRYRRAAYQAARRNGAFLRAAQDIDWTGILEELPPSRADNRLLHDRQLIKTWLEAKRGLVFSQTDDDGDTVYLLEDEDDKKLSFEELLAMEGLHGGDWEIQDDEVYDRVRDLGPVKPQRRRIQEKPGKSNLAFIVTAPTY